MSRDSFEASLHRFFDEEGKGDQIVVTPTWEVAQIIRDPKLKLKVRNEPGSAKPYSERNIDFITGLGVEDVLAKGILHLGETRALSSLSQNIRDLKAGFCAFLNAPIVGTQRNRTHWTAQQFAASDLTEFALFLRTSGISNSSRDGRVYAFKNVILAYLRVADAQDTNFLTVEALSKTNSFRSMARDAKSTTGDIKSEAKKAEKFLSIDRILAVNDAAEADVRRITFEWRKRQEAIEAGNRMLDDRYLRTYVDRQLGE